MKALVIGMIVMMLVTYLPRVIPFLLMRGEIKSQFVIDFLYYIPYAVLAAMTFPAIIDSTGNRMTGIIGMVLAVLLAYFNRSLLQVAVITVAVVYILG